MWKPLLSVRALKSGKGWNVIWEVQVSGKPGRTFLSSKKHSFLVDWFRFMMASAEPNFFEQIPKMRRMSRLLWFESLNISSWDLIKLQSQVLFKTFPIFNTHIQRTTPHEYLWQAGQNATIYISKVNALYMHILRVFRLVRLIQKLGLGFSSDWVVGFAINTVSKGGFGLSSWIAGFP